MSNKKKKALLLLLLFLMLSMASTAFAAGTAEDESAKDDDSGGITVWETFFMLLTVIPVSKMLSSIFMKLVARVGTVDEDKWAMIGLGAIGATVGLMRKGGPAALGKGGFGGFANPQNKSFGSGSGGGYSGPPGSTQPSVQPGSVGVNSSQSSNIPGVSLTSFPPSSGGSSSNGSSANTTVNQTDSQSAHTEGIPEVGQRSLSDILSISGQAGSKAAGVMAKVGAASAFAVPEVAPVTAGIYAATTKGIAGSSSAAYHLIKEVTARNTQNKQNWNQSLMQITGINNMVTATTKAATAIALSPFGSRVSNLGTSMLDKSFQQTGNAVQMVRNKIYKP